MEKKTSHIYGFSSIMGAEIACLRRGRSLSGKQLGDLVGLSQQQISRYETGVCEISTVTLCSLLHKLDVSLNSFFYLVATRLENSRPSLYQRYNSLFKMNEVILKSQHGLDVYARFEQ
jgi:transcriptional regulator with XRE-family HTH domain